jgi:hypothetical protein
VKKTFWIAAQIAWIAICLVALVEANHGYRGLSDWQVEEGLAFEMIVLSFPASLFVVMGFIFSGMLLSVFGSALPASSKPEMAVTWFLFMIAGYVQWFLVLPRLPEWWRKRRERINDCDGPIFTVEGFLV